MSDPQHSWKLRSAAAVLWLAIGVLGVITHANPTIVAANAALAAIFTYRAYLSYTATHPRPRS